MRRIASIHLPTRRLVLTLGGLVVLVIGGLALATATLPGAAAAQDDLAFPPYASNLVFLDGGVDPPEPVYFATNLAPATVLGKQVIAGNFAVLDGSDDPMMAVVFLPTENPSEYWFIAANARRSLYGLITIDPELNITWQDSLGNSGFAILF